MNEYLQNLKDSFDCVYQSAHPDVCMKTYIPPKPKNGRVIVIGAGKASAAMAQAFERHYDGELEGIVVTRYGHAKPTSHIKIMEAAHPVPDEAGVEAVNEIIKLLKTLQPDDLVICLISGGGSALLTAPVEGVNFCVLQDLNKQLLKSGAPIQEMNVVRKHLNKALGGGLAKYVGENRMITLAISDVTGDDPSIIASGATVADPSTLMDAKAILKKYEIVVDEAVRAALDNPNNETPKPDNPIFKHHEYHLIATPEQALKAAATFWNERGFNTHILDSEMQGDTNECAQKHIEFISDVYRGKTKIKLPCALLSGGETTVKVLGSGDGGPNTQFMLQAAIALQGNAKIYAMACDTDGIDGSADNAGALITPDTLKAAIKKGLNPQAYLDDNNSYAFFASIDALLKTGPTYTNVNDYRVFLLLP